MTTDLTENQLSALKDILLKAFPDVWAIYLFGSYARGDAWPSSDIDIGLLLPPGKNIPDQLALTAEIASKIGREPDLVDLREAGDVLRKEVIAEGKVLHLADPDKTLEWEAISMTEYARYREATRGIREDFEATGIGYGA